MADKENEEYNGMGEEQDRALRQQREEEDEKELKAAKSKAKSKTKRHSKRASKELQSNPTPKKNTRGHETTERRDELNERFGTDKRKKETLKDKTKINEEVSEESSETNPTQNLINRIRNRELPTDNQEGALEDSVNVADEDKPFDNLKGENHNRKLSLSDAERLSATRQNDSNQNVGISLNVSQKDKSSKSSNTQGTSSGNNPEEESNQQSGYGNNNSAMPRFGTNNTGNNIPRGGATMGGNAPSEEQLEASNPEYRLPELPLNSSSRRKGKQEGKQETNKKADKELLGGIAAGTPVVSNSLLKSNNHSSRSQSDSSDDSSYSPPITPTLGRRRGGAASRKTRKAINLGRKAYTLVSKIGCLASVIWFALILLLIIGAVSFFMNMPAMVLDNLKDFAMNIWDRVNGFVAGQDLPGEKEIESAAQYIESQGYDLLEWGFASVYEKDSKTNRINKLETKYIPIYLAAEQRCYMVNNNYETISLKSLFKGLWNMLTEEDYTLGTGVLHIEKNAQVLLKIQEDSNNSDKTTIQNKVQVYRRQKEMIISRNGFDNNFSTKGIEAYRFKMKYWIEKYTTPLDFYIAMHLASKAPEFVAELAQDASAGDGLRDPKSGDILNTRIDISVAALIPNQDVKIEIGYLDIDPKTRKVKVNEYGMPILLTVPEIRSKLAAGEEVYGLTNNASTEELLKTAEKFDASNILAFTPYITKVINHWYYKEVIYQSNASISSYGKDVDVYQWEELATDNPARIRYQMYQAVQVPGFGGTVDPNTGGNNSGGNTGGDNGSGGGSGNSGGTTGDSGIVFNPNETSTGDDRKKLEENTKIAEDAGISSGGFFGSIMDLINSFTGWIGSFGGITGMILDLPSNIMNATYGGLSNLITSAMPSNILSNISNGWLSGLGYYADGMLLNNTNMGQYLNFGKISNSLGLGKLQSILNPNTIINNLGLGQATNVLYNLSHVNSLSGLGAVAASSLDTTGMTSRLVNMSGIVQNGLTTDTFVNAMYGGISTQMRDELSSEVLNYAKIAFNGVSRDQSKDIAAGLIAGIAKDVTNKTTSQFFNLMHSNLSQQFNGQFDTQVRRLLENENSKQTTGLNISELESLSKVNNLDLDTIKEVNKDLEKINDSVEESKDESLELSNMLNEIAKKYADIDAVTFYYIAKTIREIFTELDNAEKQINNFESLFNNYNVDERTELQIRTNIERGRTAIEQSRTSINSLEVSETRTYGKSLVTAGTEIARIINDNKSKMDAVTAAILMAQGNATSDILSKSGEMVQKIDVNTITKFKKAKPSITLEGFLQTADELAAIDPKLNGLVEELEALQNKLENVNGQNANNTLNKVSEYEAKIDNITWMTAAEKTRLKEQANKVRNKTSNTRNNVDSAKMQLINMLSGTVSGITMSTINTFANQVSSLPNVGIDALLNKMREVPQEKVEQASNDFSEALATAIVEETRNDLTQKVETGLADSLNGDGQLETALQNRTSNAKGNSDSEEQQLEGSQDEILTGFYIIETRYRDYMQKSEPILIPYSFEHWKKLLIDNKYLTVYSDTYKQLKEQNATYAGNILEGEGLIEKYGQSVWEASDGNFEETIYALMASIDSVDAQYLLRYFKELFATYGPELRAAAAKKDITTVKEKEIHTIGWIFRTEKVTEIINTQTGETRIVDKSEYEPVSWNTTSSGVLYSFKNQPVYGFKEGIEIVAPETGVIVNKTDRKKNELGEIVPASITIQITGSADPSVNGMRVILKGGDYTNAPAVGGTVSKGQAIGKTTSDNIRILAIERDSHAQVSEISRYIYPPYVAINEQ